MLSTVNAEQTGHRGGLHSREHLLRQETPGQLWRRRARHPFLVSGISNNAIPCQFATAVATCAHDRNCFASQKKITGLTPDAPSHTKSFVLPREQSGSSEIWS